MHTTKPTDAYTNNPLIHRDRRLGRSQSPWVRSFACDDMSVLVVCRGPIRKEAIDVFREMGMTKVGILLSEKDSIGYPRALSPELRVMDPKHVHAVRDYTGATKDERIERIQQMIAICREHGYRYVFAGYGFMAEDAEFVRTLEEAGLVFIGPGSYTQRAAGAKDEAKRTAIANDVSVTPGVNDAAARTLLAKYPDTAALEKVAKEHGLTVTAGKNDTLEDSAERVLQAGYAKRIDLYTIEELQEQVRKIAERLLAENPGRRFRLKAIGGGGGKGQRIFSEASVVPGLVREVLGEVKATGVGDNKNLLVELNVESTRHNEIQLLGNGDWCIALGGRDCSLQMHEQKLVEISITQEGFAAAQAAATGRKADVLGEQLDVLRRMEEEAERFGRAVKLDSASTFECIVEDGRHYFMEVNTRIQVEHRVSELCYAMRFTNPSDTSDWFEVLSLVEAMALIAKHRGRLPRPVRGQREGAAIEIRLNATDRALTPAAGGVIVSWSDPIEGEVRDDQGISIKNPDTGLYMRYRLAGAYDSNVALLLATGADREESFGRVREILRRTTLRGLDLATNLEFHLGIVTWFCARDTWAKPTTAFVVPYLTLVGELAFEARTVDLEYAFQQIVRRRVAAAGEAIGPATKLALERKETLLARPLLLLSEEPHYLSAWLSEQHRNFEIADGRVRWLRNPIEVLAATYHLLHLDDQPGEPAANRIWDHDQDLLDTALAFYEALGKLPPSPLPWVELDRTLRESTTPQWGLDATRWDAVRAAHAGHQLGLDLLSLLPLIAEKTGFYDLHLNDDLSITIPDRLRDPARQDAMRKVLVPPPATKADEIVAAMGGTYYAQEAPDLPLFVSAGMHFEKGTPLYLIEVMKMFNKVYASFAGTIDAVLVDNSVVVRKGQPLFKVTPDEWTVEEDPADRQRMVRANTDRYLAQVI
ncbi:MAG TPA: biotin carboxylase N-terminal domain-containing protein [Candidatus Binatia bacterium]|jgi:acetyl/propionyl-CoA carboxylase alpha subunit|nr:biotin carboxylase N-terminal domain-containing protein [Candidatus Binatia bacterium]